MKLVVRMNFYVRLMYLFGYKYNTLLYHYDDYRYRQSHVARGDPKPALGPFINP